MNSSNNTTTVPDTATSIKTSTTPAPSANITSYSSATQFEQVKHLMSEKPLRPPVRPSN